MLNDEHNFKFGLMGNYSKNYGLLNAEPRMQNSWHNVEMGIQANPTFDLINIYIYIYSI